MSHLTPGVTSFLRRSTSLVWRRIRSLAFLLFPLLAFGLLVQLVEGSSSTLRFQIFDLVPLRVDRLSLAFAYVFILIAFLGGIYGYHLIDTGQQVAALVYAGASLGVLFAGDFFTLFVYWEIMAVASVCLIFARRTDRSREAGMRYLLVHLFGRQCAFGRDCLALRSRRPHSVSSIWGRTGSPFDFARLFDQRRDSSAPRLAG